MTPEQKAKELIERFRIAQDYGRDDSETNIELAKYCALICVEEMIAIQEDFYGLVLTEKFRERCRQRVEFLESVEKSIKEEGQ